MGAPEGPPVDRYGRLDGPPERAGIGTQHEHVGGCVRDELGGERRRQTVPMVGPHGDGCSVFLVPMRLATTLETSIEMPVKAK